MKITIDTKKGTEAVASFLQKTSDKSKRTIADVQAGAIALSEKSKQDSYLRRLKKYNPLFPDVFHSEGFNIPNMIVIRDDAERRGIDVCEGAIGWLGKVGGMEVLYLYDEAVAESRITFVPTADCDAIYYVDRFDRNRFVRVDYICKQANNERLAELEHIAYSLGAKRCVIDIVETSTVAKKSKRRFDQNKKADIPIADTGRSIELEETADVRNEYEQSQKSENEGHSVLTWSGSDKPKRPKLKWFLHDESVKGLIEMRLKGGNAVNEKTLNLKGAVSATMSKETACSIDNAIGKILKDQGSITLEKQVVKEMQSVFVFHIEF